MRGDSYRYEAVNDALQPRVDRMLRELAVLTKRRMLCRYARPPIEGAVPIRAGRRPPMATGSPPPATPSARLPPGDPGDPRYALWDTVLDVLGRLCLVAVFSLVACLLLLVVALIVMRYTP